jgi:hypothetical protein
MRLHFITIVLDGLPWLTHHLPVFNRLPFDWTWEIAHGAAQNVKDTSWMRSQPARLSTDGTTEYLRSISRHPRIRIHEQPSWPGKTAMVNACFETAQAPCIVMQIDSDEIWTAEQLTVISNLFEADTSIDRMQFWCRYFVGQNIVVGPKDGHTYGCQKTEWTRAWRMRHASQRFIKHEPPTFAEPAGRLVERGETLGYGLEFDHFAYATRPQVAYKEAVYGYPGAVEGWERLQANQSWPIPLKRFMPWVDDKAFVDLLVK